jgi:hypothetical protein
MFSIASLEINSSGLSCFHRIFLHLITMLIFTLPLNLFLFVAPLRLSNHRTSVGFVCGASWKHVADEMTGCEYSVATSSLNVQTRFFLEDAKQSLGRTRD